MLLFGTSAFGNEVGDRTLVYLALKPLPRWRIVAPEDAWRAARRRRARRGQRARRRGRHPSRATPAARSQRGSGSSSGAAAYAALFTWAGLATKHALVLGLVYVFVWEAALAAYLDGIRFLSIRRYTLALIHGLDGERLRTLDLSLGAGAGAVGAAIVIVGFSALAVRKLTRIDVP